MQVTCRSHAGHLIWSFLNFLFCNVRLTPHSCKGLNDDHQEDALLYEYHKEEYYRKEEQQGFRWLFAINGIVECSCPELQGRALIH